MPHRNAPLSPEERRRLIARCRHRPIAHVAAEMGASGTCASKWVNRFRRHGDLGLLDRSSAPRRQPTTTDADVVVRIEDLRRTQKWSAARIADNGACCRADAFARALLGSRHQRTAPYRSCRALQFAARRGRDPWVTRF